MPSEDVQFEVGDKVQNADGDILIVRTVKPRTGIILLGAEGLADSWVSLQGLTKVESAEVPEDTLDEDLDEKEVDDDDATTEAAEAPAKSNGRKTKKAAADEDLSAG